jgi:hypothetical protein
MIKFALLYPIFQEIRPYEKPYFWTKISHVGRTNLKIVDGNLNGIRYRDEILAPIVLPFI